MKRGMLVVLLLCLLVVPVRGAQEITVQLVAGENALSSPVVMRDGGVLTVFNSLPVSDVYSYSYGKWRSYHSDVPDFLNSLKMLELGRGYVVLADEPCEITFRGFAPSYWSTTLVEGPNLIGWPSFRAVTVREAFDSVWEAVERVQTFDGSKMKEDDIINPGEAYWIYVTWGVEWEVAS